MDTKGSMKVYFKIIIQEMNKAMNLEGMDQGHREKLGEAMLNTAFDNDGPRTAKGRTDDRLLFISNKLFRPISEIFTNMEALENIGIYAGSFPYKRHGISRVDYLKYHIENYLNELYIFKNRLIAYLKLVERAYKKCERSKEINAYLSPLYMVVSTTFEGYVNVRGAHVHENRYSDEDLSRLTTLSLLSMSGEDDTATEDKATTLFRQMFIETYKSTRKKWIGKIKKDLKTLEELLEIFFSALVNSIIKDGAIVYPSNMHWV